MRRSALVVLVHRLWKEPPRILLRNLVRRGILFLRRFRADLQGTTISDRNFKRALTAPRLPLHDVLDAITTSIAAINPAGEEQLLQRLQEDFPAALPGSLRAADDACAHIFDLLGSGRVEFGESVNWHVDFQAGYTFPHNRHFSTIQHAAFPGGREIHLPWELSCFQHAARLGQAYWFTEDQKYAEEFTSQVLDWIGRNPPEYGVNWTCAMEVAIRAVNWLVGFSLMHRAKAFDSDFVLRFSKSLLEHGRFIRCTLENVGRVPGNHYLADLVGLLWLGLLLPQFREAASWRAFSIRELERQMQRQVLDDGVNFEDSTNYHRLVTEMLLYSAVLAHKNGISFSAAFMDRLEKMIEAVMVFTRADGTVPQVGDADNGRLLRLKVWDPPQQEWHDFRYLLAIGAALFQRSDFALAAGDQWEEAYWLLGWEAWNFRDGLRASDNPSCPPSKIFVDAGWAVLGSQETHLLVTAGPLGQLGKGGHSHNDRLGFELYTAGQAWIVDPGTGCYTADYPLRNRMRSTASHNVIRVNGEEQHLIDEKNLFGMESMGTASIIDFSSSRESAFLAVSHDMYNRIGVSHTRIFSMQFNPFRLDIEDHLMAEARSYFEAFLHLHPALRILPGDSQIRLQNDAGKILQVKWNLRGGDRDITWETADSTYSPSYGIVIRSHVLRLTWQASGKSLLHMQFCTGEN